jgi:hypothetical protein
MRNAIAEMRRLRPAATVGKVESEGQLERPCPPGAAVGPHVQLPAAVTRGMR